MNGTSQGSQKPEPARCPMCGSEISKAPIGQAIHRQLEGTLKQMHQAAQRRPGRPAGR